MRVNGKGCSKFTIGDRVACLSKYEGQAELINLPEKYLVRLPDDVDGKAAVALILDWVTAYQMLHRVAHVKPGEKMFVHALGGAVGGALLRLGLLAGASVFGTASAKKHDELRQLGAIPFEYANKNWITAIQELGGVDAVFDPLGFESFDESYSVLEEGRDSRGIRHESARMDKDSGTSHDSCSVKAVREEPALRVWQTNHFLRGHPLLEELQPRSGTAV